MSAACVYAEGKLDQTRHSDSSFCKIVSKTSITVGVSLLLALASFSERRVSLGILGRGFLQHVQQIVANDTVSGLGFLLL